MLGALHYGRCLHQSSCAKREYLIHTLCLLCIVPCIMVPAKMMAHMQRSSTHAAHSSCSCHPLHALHLLYRTGMHRCL
jgi:hypothetical protein